MVGDRDPGGREAVLRIRARLVHSRLACSLFVFPRICYMCSRQHPAADLGRRVWLSERRHMARPKAVTLPERHSASPPSFRLRASHIVPPPSAREPIRRVSYARRCQGDEAPRPQGQNPDGAVELRRGDRGRERQRHAQAGADVRHPQAAGRQGDRDHRHRRGRGAAGRLRLPALARRQLPAGPRRHLRLALADPPLCAADRRHGRRPDPQPQGGRALLRAAQGQQDQLRGPREAAPQGALRQPDAALSDPVDEAGDRGSDDQGSLAARDRHRLAARQGPARPDRGAAAHRQDGAAAEHRPLDRRPTTPSAT